jgi:hypothetical protein
VIGNQPAQHGVGVLGVAQVPGAVELMQARDDEIGCIAYVVQPRRGFEQIGVRAENGRQIAGPGGDALDVRPAAGQGSWSSARASCCARDASVFMRPRLGSCGGTFTDVAGRPKTSCPAPRPPHPVMLA